MGDLPGNHAHLVLHIVLDRLALLVVGDISAGIVARPHWRLVPCLALSGVRKRHLADKTLDQPFIAFSLTKLHQS